MAYLRRQTAGQAVFLQCQFRDIPERASHAEPTAWRIRLQPAALIRPVRAVRAVINRDKGVAFGLGNLRDVRAGKGLSGG